MTTDLTTDLSRRVMRRLKQRPASFQDLVDEGVLTRSSAAVVYKRLAKAGVLVDTGQRVKRAGMGGRPRVMYRVAPGSRL